MVIDDQSSKDWTVTLKNSILGENNILGTIVMSFLYWVLFSLIRKLFRNISEEHSWSAVHQKNINSTKQYSVLFQHFRKIRIFKELFTLGTILKDSELLSQKCTRPKFRTNFSGRILFGPKSENPVPIRTGIVIWSGSIIHVLMESFKIIPTCARSK